VISSAAPTGEREPKNLITDEEEQHDDEQHAADKRKFGNECRQVSATQRERVSQETRSQCFYP